MNIFAGNGDTVVFSHPDYGTDYDKDLASRVLEIGKTYTVVRIDIYSSFSYMKLAEFPNLIFNPIMFEDGKVNEELAYARAKVWYHEN